MKLKLNIDPKVKNILEWVYCFIAAIIIALLIKYFIGVPTVVRRVSMDDTLEDGQRLWLNRWARTVNSKFERGDIITFEAPTVSELSLEDINAPDNIVAIYNYEPKGLWKKFTYYVLERDKISYIKRIIGVEGDIIKFEGGKVYLNGKLLDEPYLKEGMYTNALLFTEVKVPKGYVFVMGDNRIHSTDSRSFGCIPVDKIESRVAFRFWPLNKFGGVK